MIRAGFNGGGGDEEGERAEKQLRQHDARQCSPCSTTRAASWITEEVVEVVVDVVDVVVIVLALVVGVVVGVVVGIVCFLAQWRDEGGGGSAVSCSRPSSKLCFHELHQGEALLP